MSEELRYYPLEELAEMSIESLQNLWDAVPNERQRAYKQAYEREVRNAGALGSDQLEEQVTLELIRRYVDDALVPVGTRWARTPIRVREAAQSNEDSPLAETQAKESPNKTIPILVAGGIFLLFVLAWIFFHGSNEDSAVVAEMTASPEVSPTLAISPTPTPLALEAQDSIIRDGDNRRQLAYPVSLQVSLPDGSSPRVWVVQRRVVQAAEWNFEPNPDIASFVSGMSVRPVIGIPYSEDNAALFARMDEGTVFNLNMNTGANLHFEFAARSEVRRSASDIFRQVSPSLVLLLIGERDEEGLPTATRTLITATYPPEQELGRDGTLLGVSVPELPALDPSPSPEAQADSLAGLNVQLISVTTQGEMLTTRMRIYNSGTQAVQLLSDDIWLTLGYASEPIGPHIPAEGLAPLMLSPEQAVDLTLIWAWNGEPYGYFEVSEYFFAIQITE